MPKKSIQEMRAGERKRHSLAMLSLYDSAADRNHQLGCHGDRAWAA